MVPASTAGDTFVAASPEDRRHEMNSIRQWLLVHLPDGYEERVGKGLSYVVPHSVFPAGYHCDPKQPLTAVWLSLTKTGFSLHLMTIYGDAEAEAKIKAAYLEKGRKVDMGKACIRFKGLGDLETGVVGQTLASVPPEVFVERYQAALGR